MAQSSGAIHRPTILSAHATVARLGNPLSMHRRIPPSPPPPSTPDATPHALRPPRPAATAPRPPRPAATLGAPLPLLSPPTSIATSSLLLHLPLSHGVRPMTCGRRVLPPPPRGRCVLPPRSAPPSPSILHRPPSLRLPFFFIFRSPTVSCRSPASLPFYRALLPPWAAAVPPHPATAATSPLPPLPLLYGHLFYPLSHLSNIFMPLLLDFSLPDRPVQASDLPTSAWAWSACGGCRPLRGRRAWELRTRPAAGVWSRFVGGRRAGDALLTRTHRSPSRVATGGLGLRYACWCAG